MKAFKSIHIYVGLAVCQFLFFICFFGTTAYFKDEINYYMQPNLAKEINIKNIANLENTLDYALSKYANYEIIGIKTPPYFSNLYEINYYNLSSSKSEKKTNLAYFNDEEFIKNTSLGSKFLTSLHYKIFPTGKITKDIFKAFICVIAFFTLILIISGFFIFKNKFCKNAKNIYAKLLNFHIIFGAFLAIFIGYFSISGIGLSYLKDLEKLFSQNVQKAKKHAENKQLRLYDFDKNAILKAFEDAKTRLNSNDLHLVLSKPNKSILIKSIKKDRIFLDTGKTAIYKANGDFIKEIANKNFKNLSTIATFYELFFSTHRLHFAPVIFKIFLAFLGVLTCIFIYKSMLLSAAKRKNNKTLKILPSSILNACLNATLLYFIANKILNNFEANWQFLEQICFLLAFILSYFSAFFLSEKITKIINIILLVILLICDALFSYYTGVLIAFNLLFLLVILIILKSILNTKTT